jgi:hypothetical protein
MKNIQYVISVKASKDAPNDWFVTKDFTTCKFTWGKWKEEDGFPIFFDTKKEAEKHRNLYEKERLIKENDTPERMSDAARAIYYKYSSPLSSFVIEIGSHRELVKRKTFWEEWRDMDGNAKLILCAFPFVAMFGLLVMMGEHLPDNNRKLVLEQVQADLNNEETNFDIARQNGDLDGMAKEDDKIQKDRARIQFLKDDGVKE